MIGCSLRRSIFWVIGTLLFGILSSYYLGTALVRGTNENELGYGIRTDFCMRLSGKWKDGLQLLFVAG